MKKDNKTKTKTKIGAGQEEMPSNNDLAIIENIRNVLYGLFNKQPSDTKVGDILKVIELRQKLLASGDQPNKDAFWARINKVRTQELTNADPPSSTNISSAKKGEAE